MLWGWLAPNQCICEKKDRVDSVTSISLREVNKFNAFSFESKHKCWKRFFPATITSRNRMLLSQNSPFVSKMFTFVWFRWKMHERLTQVMKNTQAKFEGGKWDLSLGLWDNGSLVFGCHIRQRCLNFSSRYVSALFYIYCLSACQQEGLKLVNQPLPAREWLAWCWWGQTGLPYDLHVYASFSRSDGIGVNQCYFGRRLTCSWPVFTKYQQWDTKKH